MMNRIQKIKLLKLTLALGLLGSNLGLPSVVSYAQPDVSVMEACPIMVDGEVLDTESTQFPTVSYDIIDANLPADRVRIDVSTLFSDDWVIVDPEGKEETYYQNYMDLESYRDYSVWPMYILNYDSGEVGILAPINMTEDLYEVYSIVDFLNGHNEDMYHKLISDYMHPFTDDLDQVYHLAKGFPATIFADGKANFLRAEALYENLTEDDPNYEEATRLLEQIRFKYFVLEGRYNNACGADLYYDYFVYDDVEDPVRADEIVELIDTSMKNLPLDLQQRFFDIRVIRQDQLKERTERDDMFVKAYAERILYFSEEMADDPSQVYYGVGQMLDLITYMPADTNYDNYTSYSLADEWMAIHEAEWLNAEAAVEESTAGDAEVETDAEAETSEAEDSNAQAEGETLENLTDDPYHSFAQSFAAYALMKYHGEEMSDYGHEGMDITDHPLSQAYFDDLFTRLDFN